MKREARTRRICLPAGIELHLIEQGTGEPVLLLHGGMGDCQSWQPQLGPFSERYRVLAYSRRHSQPNRNAITPHSLAGDVDDLNGLLDALRIERACLVGTSYGAFVALAYAVAQPGRVIGLVLAEPPMHRWACRTPDGAAMAARFLADVWHPAGADFASGLDRSAIERLVDGMGGRATFASLSVERQRMALRNARAMRLHTEAPDPFPALSRAAVARIAIPSLLVHGEHTSALHKRVVDELGAVMSVAEAVTIGGAGHASPLEQPQAFNAVVLPFLGRASAGRPGSRSVA